MHTYELTDKGRSIAEASGIDDLAIKLADADGIEDPLLFDITRQDWDFKPFSLDETDTIAADAITVAYNHARGYKEKITLARGLEIGDDSDYWRRLIVDDQPTLFPRLKAVDFAPAISKDRLIVSGVVGALLERYKSRYPLLARSRSEEFGFSNHMEACAFVGARVMSKIMEMEQTRFHSKEPSFMLDDEKTNLEITVGGTFHGDFRIGATETLRSGSLSPANTHVDFAPLSTGWLGGYHSVEPDITAAMLTDEFVKFGKNATAKLLTDFEGTLPGLSDETGCLNFRRGAFADYGDGEAIYPLMPLSVLIDNPGTTTARMRAGKLYSSSHQPQSRHLFEIKPLEDGLRFQGRDEGAEEPESGIDIPRENYPDLFSALLRQAQEGLGRTSPQQHLDVIVYASRLLKGEKIR